ncbi:sugar-binding domain-containing protein [Aestuariibaculum suncheonense]|nr:sugar-binding domain-containing protein [Aestuariibaculum suncheonense]
MISTQVLRMFFFSIALIMFHSCKNEEELKINLSGEWRFKIDSLDAGIEEKWYQKALPEVVSLPGSMAQNGKGNDITVDTKWTGNMWNDSLWYTDPEMKKYREKGNVKVPFWLTPVKEYTGPAWYQKEVSIPESWSDRAISLNLERVHWESTLWVDDQVVGSENSLATSHSYNLSEYLSPGKHVLTIRIDNRVKDIDVGLDAHSISDNTQTNWNGIIGDISLSAVSKLSIGQVKMYPDVSNKKVRIAVQIENRTGLEQEVELTLQAKEKSGIGETLPEINKTIQVSGITTIELEYPMGDNPKLWDEFNPNLYDMYFSLRSETGLNKKIETFGMRDFKTKGTIFTINNRPVFLRGTLECAIFPLTGYPPTDIDAWKRIYKIIQNHGLNHMRFHSWCPPKAAFTAADEMGVYLQVEASAWATIGDGKPVDKWLYKEAEDIINTYGNHPSFVMMAYGNEPSGDNHKDYLVKFVDHFKSFDNRRVYTSGAGWPYIDNADYFNTANPRIQHWNAQLNSIINKNPPQTTFDFKKIIDSKPMPTVSHEIGQWCVYPNFKEMSKYTGVLKPKNFEIFKESLEENGMLELADSLLLASGKLQTLCYKADIEAALRTKDFAGFQLLDLHDFPGQGTALVGVLDAFWDEKGYVTPEEYSRFCNETVPLVRLEKRIFKNTDTLKASVEVAHFGAEELTGVIPTWKITDDKGASVFNGQFDKIDIVIGNGIQLGNIGVAFNSINKGQKLTLTVDVSGFENSWDVWVYPKKKEKIEKENIVKVVNNLDASTLSYLQKGGKVLLNVTKGDIAPEMGGDIGVGFSSIFWNTSWTKGQKPHTLGILCNPEHPALAHFPSEYHSNWQWWDAMSHSNAIVLDHLPKELTPIIRIVDDWFENRKTALIFEAKVGKGSLLMSGIDLHTDLENRLEAQQLLYSLKSYMISEDFNPKVNLSAEQIKALLK